MPILDGFATLFSNGTAVAFTLAGTVLGLLAGAMPGISAGAVVALLMPLTFYMDTLPALAFAYTVTKAGSFGGSIPAILFSTPGTAAAAATQIEGFPLTLQGKQGKAMRMAVIASAMGDTYSELLLIFGAVYAAGYAAKLGPAEYFAVYSCAFIIISSVIGRSVVRGLLSTLLGILVALMGYDPITGMPRFGFGWDILSDGVTLVPLLIGVFVMSEVIARVVERSALTSSQTIAPASTNPDDNRVTWPEFKASIRTILRSGFLGSMIGMLPGVGASVACFVGYAEARRAAPHKKWGEGELDGVAAAEAANNATSGANLIPLLSLGIPGSAAAALLAGIFVIHGITVGPRVFVDDGQLIYALFASGLVCIATYFLVGYFGSGLVGRLIAKVPIRLIYPVIFITCFIATFALRQTMFDMVVMALFGAIGYAMKRWDFSIPAFIIAFLLGKGAEESLRQTMLLSDDGLLYFFQRPLALLFFAIGALTVILRVRALLKARNGPRVFPT